MQWDRRVEDMARDELEHHALTLRVQVEQYRQATAMLMDEADRNAQLDRLKWQAALNVQVKEVVVPGPTEAELHQLLNKARRTISDERWANTELSREVVRLQGQISRPWWRRLFNR